MTRERPWWIPDTVNTPDELEAFARATRQPILRLLWALGTVVEVYRQGRRQGLASSDVSVMLARYERIQRDRELAR